MLLNTVSITAIVIWLQVLHQAIIKQKCACELNASFKNNFGTVFVSFNGPVYTQNISNFALPMMFYVLLYLNRTSSCCGWRYNRRDPFICSPWNNCISALEKNLPPLFLWKAHQSCQNNKCKCHFPGSGKFWNSTKKHKVHILILFLKHTLCHLFQLVKSQMHRWSKYMHVQK